MLQKLQEEQKLLIEKKKKEKEKEEIQRLQNIKKLDLWKKNEEQKNEELKRKEDLNRNDFKKPFFIRDREKERDKDKEKEKERNKEKLMDIYNIPSKYQRDITPINNNCKKPHELFGRKVSEMHILNAFPHHKEEEVPQTSRNDKANKIDIINKNKENLIKLNVLKKPENIVDKDKKQNELIKNIPSEKNIIPIEEEKNRIQKIKDREEIRSKMREDIKLKKTKSKGLKNDMKIEIISNKLNNNNNVNEGKALHSNNPEEEKSTLSKKSKGKDKKRTKKTRKNDISKSENSEISNEVSNEEVKIQENNVNLKIVNESEEREKRGMDIMVKQVEQILNEGNDNNENNEVQGKDEQITPNEEIMPKINQEHSHYEDREDYISDHEGITPNIESKVEEIEDEKKIENKAESELEIFVEYLKGRSKFDNLIELSNRINHAIDNSTEISPKIVSNNFKEIITDDLLDNISLIILLSHLQNGIKPK